MAGITISGLGSGLDIESIISSLMKIERAPLVRLETRRGQVEARSSALSQIRSALQALEDAAAALRSTPLWADVQAVSSSDPAAVSARRLSGAGPGGYQVEVTQLARAEQRTYDFTPSETPSQLAINGATVELGANATLSDAVTAINANAATGVFAVQVAGQLVLSSRATGAASTINASGSTLTEDAVKLRPGQDAAFAIDGVAGSSSSNVVTGAIPGLELTLGEVTTSPVTVTVGNPGPDTEAVEAKLRALVDAYNAALDSIRSRVTEKRVPNAATQADANKGVLFGDTMLNGLLAQMRRLASEAGLSQLGISTGTAGSEVSADSDAVIGRLSLDTAKLSAALEKDPAGTRALLADPGGFAASLGELLESVTGFGGMLAQRLDAASEEADSLRDSMDALDDRLALREERLRAQFAALESALIRNQSQGAWLSGQIMQLNS